MAARGGAGDKYLPNLVCANDQIMRLTDLSRKGIDIFGFWF